MKYPILAILAATIGLVVACAAPTRAERAQERGTQLREALATAVSDAARRAELLQSIDEMEAAMLATIEQGNMLHREFVTANSDPNADEQGLREIALRIATARRDGMRRVMQARLDLRHGMSPGEWAEFARVLPAFDGGQS